MVFKSKKPKDQKVVAKLSFQERLDEAKGVFRKAFEDASKLNVEMESSIESKKQQVKSIEEEIALISTTQKETKEFMSNLERLI